MTDIVFNVTILDLSSVSKFSTFIDDSKLLYRFNFFTSTNIQIQMSRKGCLFFTDQLVVQAPSETKNELLKKGKKKKAMCIKQINEK